MIEEQGADQAIGVPGRVYADRNVGATKSLILLPQFLKQLYSFLARSKSESKDAARKGRRYKIN